MSSLVKHRSRNNPVPQKAAAEESHNRNETSASLRILLLGRRRCLPLRAPHGSRYIPAPACNSNAGPLGNPRCRLPPFLSRPLSITHSATLPPKSNISCFVLLPLPQRNFPRVSATARDPAVPSAFRAGEPCHRDSQHSPPNNPACSLRLFLSYLPASSFSFGTRHVCPVSLLSQSA